MDYNTQKLLGIQDLDITFKEEWHSFRKDKRNRLSQIIEGSLEKRPSYCPSCGVAWESTKDVYAHGTTPKKRKIQLPEIDNKPTYLELTIHRFKCRHCSVVSANHLPNYFVKKRKSICVRLHLKILMELKDTTNSKKVASICKTGYQIVYQTSLSLAHYVKKLPPSPLPRVLAIDEFKATKDCEGSMAFIAMDWESGQIHTILDDRRSHKLLEFFNGYSYEERCKVEFVVMDMNAAYDSMVKKAFPEAQIVIDRFHIVQHLTNAFKTVRIQEMNKLNRYSGEEAKKYRRIKRLWRLLQKDYGCLSSEAKYNPLLNRYVSAQDIALELANYSPVLMETWNLYQLLLGYFKERNADYFFDLIRESQNSELLPQSFRDKLAFLLKKEESIRLALSVPYNNGLVEGTNNKIKLLKRSAFGYRKHEHLFARVYWMQSPAVHSI